MLMKVSKIRKIETETDKDTRAVDVYTTELEAPHGSPKVKIREEVECTFKIGDVYELKRLTGQKALKDYTRAQEKADAEASEAAEAKEVPDDDA